jgi:hypothetical protein
MSTKDRLDRKKYMGVWRWESEQTARTIIMFPSSVTRYMYRNSTKRMGCSPGSSDSTRRWNSETPVIFCASILLGHL